VYGKWLQEFAAAVQNLSQQALAKLPVDVIQRETAHEILNGIRDCYAYSRLLIYSKKFLNETPNQFVKTKAANVSPGLPMKLQEVRVVGLMRKLLPETEHCRIGQLIMLTVLKYRSPVKESIDRNLVRQTVCEEFNQVLKSGARA
jgi:hypothetical protein